MHAGFKLFENPRMLHIPRDKMPYCQHIYIYIYRNSKKRKPCLNIPIKVSANKSG
jgi:hypothetical protein